MASAQHVGLADDLARRIRAARVLSGKAVSEVARESGMHKRKVWRLEAGHQEPTALELAEIARVTGQPIEFFYVSATASTSGPNGATISDPDPDVNRKDNTGAQVA